MDENEVKQELEDFRAWLEEKELSENTIDTYTYAVREFYERYEELTKRNLIAYKEFLIANRAPKTAGIRCIAINQYCIFKGKRELCLKTIKIQKARTVENVISREQYEYLLSRLKEDKNEKGYFMILFLATTGARVSEFVRFRKADLEKGYCELWTKGKIRRILFPRKLVEESAEYFQEVKEDDYLFPNRSGKQMTTRGLAEVINRMGSRYGIPENVMHPHAFRHLFAIEFLKKNSNIALLADLMGHESVDTTAIYLRMSASEQAEQFNRAVDW